MKNQNRDFRIAQGKALVAESRELRNEAITYLRTQGKEYPLTEWITIRNYALKYGVSTQLISQWIARKIIPAENVLELAELNGIRLVRDIPYRSVEVSDKVSLEHLES